MSEIIVNKVDGLFCPLFYIILLYALIVEQPAVHVLRIIFQYNVILYGVICKLVEYSTLIELLSYGVLSH